MAHILKHLGVAAFVLFAASASAQTFTRYTSTDGDYWKESRVKGSENAEGQPIINVKGDESIMTFKGWGTCFNELGWDALQVLPEEKQDELLKRIFSPDGDLKYTHGRFSLGANDYARDWYSASMVAGDFELRYFNMTRDLSTIIPYMHAAQKHNPDLWFWCSPWSPPAWMKINQDYPVLSSRYNKMDRRLDYLLHRNSDPKTRRHDRFPDWLAGEDYFIQDPRYLKAYADYFCRYIEEYGKNGIPVKRVMYQNEAYSYTAYPGCPWTPHGAALFNAEYLAPALKEKCPDVELYLGTFNTNRFEEVDGILSDDVMKGKDIFTGLGFQWEGSQIIPQIRNKYPHLKVVQTESECGSGTFDWRAAEHTFGIINDYLGKGCEEYTFWNVILCDRGESAWGWKQNALIRVDSQAKTATLTPEYYAVKHYSHFVTAGTKLLGAYGGRTEETPAMIFKTPAGKYVVVAGNRANTERRLTLKLGEKHLETTLAPHSFQTFVED
ncbi:MAG: glycoside hydrolase family 30 protein [Lentisphaeria bacterium]|nr:glycoside hydrolase family 30 protein [Lentisphaeria bacterium]